MARESTSYSDTHFNAWISPEGEVFWKGTESHGSVAKKRFEATTKDMLRDGFIRVSWQMLGTIRIVEVQDLKKRLSGIQSALLPLFEQFGDVDVFVEDIGIAQYEGVVPLGTLALGTYSEIMKPERSNPDINMLPYVTYGMKGLLLGDPKTNKIRVVGWKATGMLDPHHDDVAKSFKDEVVIAKLLHGRTGIYVVVDDAKSRDEAEEVMKRAAEEFDWENIYRDDDAYLDWGLNRKTYIYTESLSMKAGEMMRKAGIKRNPPSSAEKNPLKDVEKMSDADVLALGKWIASVLWSKEGFEILDQKGYDAWHIGGCAGTARALQYWLGAGDTMALINPGSPIAQHLVLKIGDFYFDGRPKQSASKIGPLLNYWRKEAGMSDAVVVPVGKCQMDPGTTDSLVLERPLIRLLERRYKQDFK